MLPRLKVHLLDDEEIVCKFIENKFKNDYEFKYSTKESDCEQLLEIEKPDFLLIDYYLENSTGLEFYEKNIEILRGVEIIFISGQKTLTDMFKVINQTKSKFVIKDENLLQCLEYLFEGNIEAYSSLI